jgi:8-oxo-dGTP pyrophosphatase MutT (NUDIX family)
MWKGTNMYSAEFLLQSEVMTHEVFKQGCLERFRSALAERNYPGYPTERLSIENGAQIDFDGTVFLPKGPWDTEPTVPDGLALHPWAKEMLRDPRIGVVTGRGFYWHYGPNRTADAIVFRHDLTEPHLLLIRRSDTGEWALPGGFIDGSESGLSAAMREANEEAAITLDNTRDGAKEIYVGPLTDLRATIHAWSETSAYRFDLPNDVASQLTELTYEGGDDATAAAWLPLSLVKQELFGSHGLLVQMALEDMPA